MPDWTYQTIFKPAFKRMPFATAQRLAFGTLGLLGRMPPGRAVIQFMGHARADDELGFSVEQLDFPSRCGLGCGVDLDCRALSALSLFGFGVIEVGPVVLNGQASDASEWKEDGLRIGRGLLDVASLQKKLAANSFRNGVKVFVRLPRFDDSDSAELLRCVSKLAPLVDGFTVELSDKLFSKHAGILKEISAAGAFFGVVSANDPQRNNLVTQAVEHGCGGIVLNAAKGDDAAAVLDSLPVVASGEGPLLIWSGSVHEPADALKAYNAGADMVLVDGGFADAGPGLPKRINNAVLAERRSLTAPKSVASDITAPQRSWFWAFLLGLALTIGGILALAIGCTRVLLPYDEEFLEMLRAEVCGINDRLLPFMSHDRVTLAGTMLALGPLYMMMAWFADRRGQHWARVAVIASAFVGFAAFFLFLGFGYFDPFHAFISAICFQLTTLCLRSTQTKPTTPEFDLHNSPAWKRALWGQLLMVVQGAAILIAGIAISSFGVSTVFVEDDLAFMSTTREILVEANPRLVPLVAHDRASFGGMLMATGITVLLAALWGWQRGRRWLWWTLLGTGSTAYITTLGIHFAVGYTSLRHLLPAYGGMLVLWLASALSRPWMLADASKIDRDA